MKWPPATWGGYFFGAVEKCDFPKIVPAIDRWKQIKHRDLPNLDFVRSVAVISVVLEHTLISMGILKVGPFPIPYLGIVGVMVFFVHTTLVLMWSLERKPHTLDFYIRRVFRIYPLALAAIAVTVLLHAPVAGTIYQPFGYGNPGWKDVLIQATLVPNMLTVKWPIMGVLWSLPYEVEMCVLLPVLFFFLRKNFAVWPLLLLWTMTVFLTRGESIYSHNFGVAIGYFLPGAMAYVGFGQWKPIFPAWTLAAFLAMLWVAFLLHANFQRGWIVCLLLGLGLPLFQQLRAKWLISASHTVAKYSYGIYLTHPFALVIGFYLLAGHSLWLRLLAEAIALVIFPVAAYHLLEHPLIKVGARLTARTEKRCEVYQ
jgi:peptidoglycan/LPS O-acetylase OafA/YrhL